MQDGRVVNVKYLNLVMIIHRKMKDKEGRYPEYLPPELVRLIGRYAAAAPARYRGADTFMQMTRPIPSINNSKMIISMRRVDDADRFCAAPEFERHAGAEALHYVAWDAADDLIHCCALCETTPRILDGPRHSMKLLMFRTDGRVADMDLDLPITRGYTAHLLNNRELMLVIGGRHLLGKLSDKAVGRVQVIDLDKLTASVTYPSSPFPDIYNHASVLMPDDSIIIIGGNSEVYKHQDKHNAVNRIQDMMETDPTCYTRTVVYYNHAMGRSVNLAPMSISRSRHRAVLLRSGEILVIAGYTAERGIVRWTTKCEIFSPRTNRWRPACSMPREYMVTGAMLMRDSRVLVTAHTRDATNPVLIYSPDTDTWKVTVGDRANGPIDMYMPLQEPDPSNKKIKMT